jgi:hypothetical protein
MPAIEFYWLGGWGGLGGAFLTINLFFWGAVAVTAFWSWVRER